MNRKPWANKNGFLHETYHSEKKHSSTAIFSTNKNLLVRSLFFYRGFMVFKKKIEVVAGPLWRILIVNLCSLARLFVHRPSNLLTLSLSVIIIGFSKPREPPGHTGDTRNTTRLPKTTNTSQFKMTPKAKRLELKYEAAGPKRQPFLKLKM